MAERLNASPGMYGVSVEAAEEYQELYDGYASAIMQCVRGVRTIPATTAKNQAAAALRVRSAQFVMLILAQRDLSDAQKMDIGVTPRVQGAPIPPPNHAPFLAILSVSNLTATVWLSDATNSLNGGRPAGTIGAMVYSFVGPVPPNLTDDWKHEGGFGRTKFNLTFPAGLPPGVQVWFTANWFNGRKQRGPACAPKSCHLPGGGVSLGGGLMRAA